MKPRLTVQLPAVRVELPLHEALVELAECEGRTVSSVIREAVRLHVKSSRPEKHPPGAAPLGGNSEEAAP